MQPFEGVELMVLTGPYGLGKSSVAYELARVFERAQVSYALIEGANAGLHLACSPKVTATSRS